MVVVDAQRAGDEPVCRVRIPQRVPIGYHSWWVPGSEITVALNRAALTSPPVGRVSLAGVTKRFGDVTAVDHLDLEIADGEFLVLLGPSGCGKSTALRMIAGLEELTEGTIMIGDRVVNDVEPKDRDLAMVFQSYALYPHLTVAKNIEFPLRTRGVPEGAARRAGGRGGGVARARRVSSTASRRSSRAASASGWRWPGRSCATRRRSSWTSRCRTSTPSCGCRPAPSSWSSSSGSQATVVYVTHDQVEAMTMGHRIAIMSEGVLQQVGAPQDVYATPANLFVARFIGTPPMNTLPGPVVGEGDGIVVGIRPEHLTHRRCGRTGPGRRPRASTRPCRSSSRSATSGT